MSMKTLRVCMEAADIDSNADCLLWNGWDAPKGVASLEDYLRRHLIQIRTEHMEWAYNIGQLKLESGETLQSALQGGSAPSMWWTSLLYERHPKLSPNLYIIYKLRCLEMIILEGGYDRIELAGGAARLAASIASLCDEMDVDFEAEASVEENGRSLKERIYWLMPGIMRAAIRYGHWRWKVLRRLKHVSELPKLPPAADGHDKPATIITYFPNIDLREAGFGRFKSRYWESLHDALNNQAKLERPDGPHFVNWLFIRFPSPDFSLDQCIDLARKFQKEGKDGLSFTFLEQFLNSSALREAMARWSKIARTSFSVQGIFSENCHFAGSKLNFWPYMREQWAESMRGWRSLERCLFNTAFRRQAEMAGPQRWTLFALENCPWEHMAVEACRRVEGHGPIFGAQHSTVRSTDFRYFDAPQTFTTPDCTAFQPDIIAGNGQSAIKQWLDNGMPAQRLRQVEALRYLYLANRKSHEAPARDLPPQPGEPLEPGFGKRMLILTSFFADETKQHLRLLKEALSANLLADWRVILKPHPYGPVQWWLDSLDNGLQKKIFLSLAPLEEELSPGTTVWASNSTSASLEAAIVGLPLMVMASFGDFDLCPIQDAPGLARTGSLADVEKALPGLAPLHLPPDYLDLNPGLPAWRELLGLEGQQ